MSKSRKHRERLLGVIMMLILVVACSDVIDLDNENTGGQLVVFGRITNGTFGNEIRISRTAFDGQAPEGIAGALVTVSDNAGNVVRYESDNAGNYLMNDQSFTGVPGESYTLQIVLANGNTYRSVTEVMPSVSAKDSLYFELRDIENTSSLGVTSTQSVVSVFSDTDIFDPRPDLFIKWDVEEVFTYGQAYLPTHNFPFYSRRTCYITNKLEEQRILLYDGSELRASEINQQSIVDRRIDEDFRGLHYFNLIQQSLTAGAHRFWQALDQNVNRVGSIFDQPPGAVPGNVYNVDDPSEKVLGYFEVMATDTVHLRITNQQIDRFFPEPCPLDEQVNFVPLMCFRCLERFYKPECLDCTVLPNSSTVRPSYFD